MRPARRVQGGDKPLGLLDLDVGVPVPVIEEDRDGGLGRVFQKVQSADGGALELPQEAIFEGLVLEPLDLGCACP